MTSFQTPSGTAPRSFDVIVIGAGVAGLAFTLRLPPDLRVALLTKSALGESNTRYAQGGLAAAVGADDSPELHLADTLIAGAGLCDEAAVRALVEGAPDAVRWLIGIGTAFDREGDDYALGREGAHSRRRVLHAGGDATGAEIERALVARVRSDANIEIHEHAYAYDLVVSDGRCAGVLADIGTEGSTELHAPITVIAAGGAGQLWATTSNPPGATADGLAMALRAGVTVADLEFMQFHPTVLAIPETAPFLVSEAVRGEGAWLRDASGRRFMERVHPQAELAPRDVVARAIQRQIIADDTDHVSLDLRHLDPGEVRRRFPTIAAELAARGLDMTTDLIPIAPAAHYFMGGIVAGTDGRTSLPGLLALGEASCTGVHGANRLASNSLLEGLVFGLNAADRLSADDVMTRARRAEPARPSKAGAAAAAPDHSRTDAGTGDLREQLQRTMSRNVSVLRDAGGLTEAARTIQRLRDELLEGASGTVDRRGTAELRNMLDAAGAIVAAARQRGESRGAHARSDFPITDPDWDGQHSLLSDGQLGRWERGPLSTAHRDPVSYSQSLTIHSGSAQGPDGRDGSPHP